MGRFQFPAYHAAPEARRKSNGGSSLPGHESSACDSRKPANRRPNLHLSRSQSHAADSKQTACVCSSSARLAMMAPGGAIAGPVWNFPSFELDIYIRPARVCMLKFCCCHTALPCSRIEKSSRRVTTDLLFINESI